MRRTSPREKVRMNTWHLRYCDESVGCDVMVSCGHSERQARSLARLRNAALGAATGQPRQSPYPYYYATHGNDQGDVGTHVAQLLDETARVKHE